ncbi:MAG: hypothetical protein ACMG6S_13160 [Byssovorax sp.]
MKNKSDIVGTLAFLVVSTLYISSALANHTFLDPRIDGRNVDRCVNSQRFPDNCSEAASNEAARRFCAANGYTDIVQYQTVDHHWLHPRPTVKWYEEWSGGVLLEHFKPEMGGWIFTAIECH